MFGVGNGLLKTGALIALLALVLPVLAACGGDDAGDEANQDITIGLGFVPNIQFAPFYVADAKGYYQEEGLEVTFNHHAAGADLFGPLVAGDEGMLMAGGDEVLQASSQGAPLVYVAEIFRQYPVALIVPADSDIQAVADLAGHSVGLPGEYGANYIGLLALLEDAGLTRDDIELQSVGFTQATALLSGEVDAVMGYINNEPIQIEKGGMEVRTFPVSEAKPLVSNGLVVTSQTLDDDPEQVEKLVAATLKGLQYTIEHPDEALEIAKEYVPTLSDEQQAADAKLVLEATIPLWQSDGKPGEVDAAAWEETMIFLQSIGLLAQPVETGEVLNLDLLPE
jgi:NitT/TauT family transport system substrate-binding protein